MEAQCCKLVKGIQNPKHDPDTWPFWSSWKKTTGVLSCWELVFRYIWVPQCAWLALARSPMRVGKKTGSSAGHELAQVGECIFFRNLNM